MLELKFVWGSFLQTVLETIESVKDLVVKDVNFTFSGSGFSMEAVDSNQTTLVSVLLRAKGFEHYRYDNNVMGINFDNVAEMLKCARKDDVFTIKADEESVVFMFKSPHVEAQDKISNFKMKLKDIKSEHHGMPEGGYKAFFGMEAEYKAIVRMPSAEFVRICRDLTSTGVDTVVISVTNEDEGVVFSTRGDIVDEKIVCRKNTSVKPHEAVLIEMQEPVSLTFALRYMNSFAKATPLAEQVTISLSSELPVMVEYKVIET